MESSTSNLSAVKDNCIKNKPREDRRVKCPVCDKVFKFGFSTSKIWSHLSKSHKIQTYNFLCFVCAQIFPGIRLLNAHQKQAHTNGAKHKCLICGNMATSVADLKEHMVKRHRNYKRRYVDCRLCRRYIRNKNFCTHLQKKHVENILDEIQPSPSSLPKRKGRSKPMKKSIAKSNLENLPKALDAGARSSQPVAKAELGQCENPMIPTMNMCSGVDSSPVNNEQFRKTSFSNQTCMVGAAAVHRSQTAVIPGSTVWEYSLAISDSVFVTSPDSNGVWLEWILDLPDAPPINN